MRTFEAADWLLTITTLVAFFVVWHEYLVMALSYVWAPSLLDSLFPFAFLAVEAFMAHFVAQAQREWLLVFGLGNLLGMANWVVQHWQIRAFAEENRGIPSALATERWPRIVLAASLVVFCLGAWALYDVLRLGQIQLVVTALALVGLTAFAASGVPHWHKLRAVTRQAPHLSSTTTTLKANSTNQAPL